jgi:hypothetical protein
MLFGCLITVNGCRATTGWTNPGPGTKLLGRFGLEYEKRVLVWIRVEKSAPVQYSIIELDHQSQKWLEKTYIMEYTH